MLWVPGGCVPPGGHLPDLHLRVHVSRTSHDHAVAGCVGVMLLAPMCQAALMVKPCTSGGATTGQQGCVPARCHLCSAAAGSVAMLL